MIPATKSPCRQSMFEDRAYKRTCCSVPQSLTSLAAAFLEPPIPALVFVALSAWCGAGLEPRRTSL